MSPRQKYLTLVRRELWEHRSLWIVPVVVAGLLLCAAMFGALHVGNGINISTGGETPPGSARYVGAAALLGITTVICLFAAIGIVVYLLDCLYAERKDRSILFWKSLPVSDTETVLVKLAVALVIVPLLVVVLAVLLQPLLAGIFAVRLPATSGLFGEVFAGTFAALVPLAGFGVFAILWYAPVATYLMLASIIAKRTPLMYAALPVVSLGAAERLVLGSDHVFRFIGNRLVPQSGQMVLSPPTESGWRIAGGNWSGLYPDPALWLGVVAAAAMVFVVIRLRRYRDDT